MPDDLDELAKACAAALYPHREELDGADLSAAQCEQDPEAGRWEWINEASKILTPVIRRELGRLAAYRSRIRKDSHPRIE